MISEKRSQAARANGARSRGPVTPEGKAISSRNALRHGLLAATVVLGNEDAKTFEGVFYMLIERFSPVDDIELSAIEEMAASHWRLRRVMSMERALLDAAILKLPTMAPRNSSPPFSPIPPRRPPSPCFNATKRASSPCTSAPSAASPFSANSPRARRNQTNPSPPLFPPRKPFRPPLPRLPNRPATTIRISSPLPEASPSANFPHFPLDSCCLAPLFARRASVRSRRVPFVLLCICLLARGKHPHRNIRRHQRWYEKAGPPRDVLKSR
uniref:Uncharacterized protein n=1 Tax=Solibacter usitatus (strain Ellin6076) TaxID=234267 RepID=Q01VG7_SOLUE